MSAHQLRQVGNRGVWLDPADVVAVERHRSDVAVLLAAGARVVVSSVDAMQMATDADVDQVVAQLTAPGRGAADGFFPGGIDPTLAFGTYKKPPLVDPAERWDQKEGQP